MKLYEINEELGNALETAINEMAKNGHISEESLQRLKTINLEFTEKVNAIACVIKNKCAFAKALKVEGNKQIERSKKEFKDATNMENYLLGEMRKANREEIKTPQNLIKIKKNSEHVYFSDEKKFISWAQNQAKHLLKYEIPKPILKDIKTAICSGEDIPYATLVQAERIDIK